MFTINGIIWNLRFVDASDAILMRSDGSFTVGVTDEPTHTVYLSDLLKGSFLRKVICHELTHCFSFSYNLSIPIDTEEMIADFISVYGEDLIYLLDDLMRTVTRQNNLIA